MVLKLKKKLKKNKLSDGISLEFENLVNRIPDIGYEWHKKHLLKNAKLNNDHIEKSIKGLHGIIKIKKDSCIIISSGPSVHKQKLYVRVSLN